MTDKDLHFPVLTVQGHSVRVHSSREELTACTDLAQRKGWHVGMELFEPDGKHFVVRTATRVASGAMRSLVDRLFNRRVSVELELTAKGVLSLAELKVRVATALRRRHGSLDTEREQAVSKAESIAELFRALSGVLA